MKEERFMLSKVEERGKSMHEILKFSTIHSKITHTFSGKSRDKKIDAPTSPLSPSATPIERLITEKK